jgi:D-glycerate 3-kinase
VHGAPLVDRVLEWISEKIVHAPRRPLIAGVSAPQGAGKTTLVRQLVSSLKARGLSAVGVSIDDFYLRREEQLALAAAHPGNPYLEHRGYPGTHDVALGVQTLEALRAGGVVDLPRYDKTAHGGRGDRSPRSERVEGPFDVVLLEGWMLGFTPVPTADPQLQVINEKLAAYEAWYRSIDVLICLRAEDPSFVLEWRVQAETTLSRADVEDYVRRFLPAYALYADTVSNGRWSAEDRLMFTLDLSRSPLPQGPQGEGQGEG